MSAISEDAKATLLLCHPPPTWPVKGLNYGEYNALAIALDKHSLRPRDLLSPDFPERAPGLPIDTGRIKKLLERFAQLAQELDQWQRAGIWVICRADKDRYPSRLRAHLGSQAPVLLYGIGASENLEMSGLAVVGSRNASEESLGFAQSIGAECAARNIAVVSGCAKGIDSEAMLSCLENGGRAVGVAAEGLLNIMAAKKWRHWLADGQLALVSAYPPALAGLALLRCAETNMSMASLMPR